MHALEEESYGPFARGDNLNPLLRHMQKVFRLFQRTLKQRLGHAFTQLFVRELNLYFHISAPLKMRNGGWMVRRVLLSHRLYSALKETFSFMLDREMTKFPTVRRSLLAPARRTFGRLEVTYDRPKTRFAYVVDEPARPKVVKRKAGPEGGRSKAERARV
ncbi:hypothetical protein EJ02DRAFT_417517 [Clathrospora elynae]|uniref:Uncharacterized protein n=1 Tax=Clathrospora elynae TaxID=706981 RepID=A0A6A5T769_9PLEO|nr:hypothetical protein EJ02DRAFT_417517 [Clathrospora elynae]